MNVILKTITIITLGTFFKIKFLARPS